MNLDQEAMGGRLCQARREAGMSHRQAAAAIGVGAGEYAALEQGRRVLRADELIVLAGHFGVSIATITTAVHSTAHLHPRNAQMERSLRWHLDLDAHLAAHGI